MSNKLLLNAAARRSCRRIIPSTATFAKALSTSSNSLLSSSNFAQQHYHHHETATKRTRRCFSVSPRDPSSLNGFQVNGHSPSASTTNKTAIGNRKLQELSKLGLLDDKALNIFVLEQLSGSTSSEAAKQAQELIEELYQDHGYVTDHQYCLALEVAAKHQDEAALKKLVTLVEQQRAEEKAFDQTLERLAREGKASEAQTLLEEYTKPVRPQSVLHVLEAWAKSANEQEDAIQHMPTLVSHPALHNKAEFPCQPTKMLVRAHAMAGNIDEVEDLLTNMNWKYQEGDLQARPDLESFNWALQAHANAEIADPERAEAILEHMKMLYANRYDDKILHVDPDAESYRAVLEACANAQKGDIADKVFEALTEDFKGEGKEHVTRTIETLNTVLRAWSSNQEGCTNALEIMKIFYKVGLMRSAPNETSYALVMHSVLNSTTNSVEEKKRDVLGFVEQARGYLNGEEPKDEMELFMQEFGSNDSAEEEQSSSTKKREHKTYHDMLPSEDGVKITLPNSDIAMQEAEVLLIAKTELERLQHQYCGGEVSYECVQAQMQAIRHFLPDSKEIRARAIGDLVLSKDDSDSDSEDDKTPQKDAAASAHDEMRGLLLNEYMGKHEEHDESHEPTLAKFNTLLDAMARSKSPGAAERMEAIVEHMKELQRTGKLDGNPDTFSYNSVILAAANFGEAKRAQDILERMYQEFASGNQDTKPDLQSFSYVITAWSKSGLPDAEERAEFLLTQMKEFLKLGVRKDSGILNLERAYVQSVKGDQEKAFEVDNGIEIEATRSPEYDASK